MKPAVLCLLASLPASAAPSRVQGPDGAWLTYRTAHYRIHAPDRPDFRAFAEEVAARIEGIHTQVVDWVGYASPRPIHVLIKDPLREANGSAWPFLERPWVELWKTPPEADSALGHATSWVDLLVTHELAHIHHLMRPQHRPTLGDRLLDLPMGPVTRKAPRWVVEGYATVIEGRITGSGRPHGPYRAAQLRQWALQGKLPDYGQLSGFGGFRGGGQAYLVGSAFLEWLERRPGQRADILKAFWKQLASKRRRNFEASFQATFGQGPQEAYDRFRAEVTHDALALEKRLRESPGLREGALWAKVPGEVTDLAVSPDGTRLLARVLTPDFRGLRVWDLTPPKPAAPTPAPRPAPAPDPEEVEDVQPEVPPRKPIASLGRFRGTVPRKPRWSADGQKIWFGWRTPASDGSLEDRGGWWRPRSRAEASPDAPPPAPTSAITTSLDAPRWDLVLTVPGHPPRPLTRTLGAAWNPAPTPDGTAVFYTQLTATGVEIRRLDLTLPPLAEAPLPVDPAPLAPGTILSEADQPSRLPAPVPPPAAAPYRVGDSLWNRSRSGFAVGPSGTSYQMGAGGTDLLQRASWLALASFGTAAGPRGALLSGTWRGWRWAPTLSLVSSLARPSRQPLAPVEGWDRERRGALLSFTWEDRAGRPALLQPFVAAERVTLLPGATLRRAFAGLETALQDRWLPSEKVAFGFEGTLLAARGRTQGQDWHLQRATFEAGFRNPVLPLRASGELAGVGGAPTALDRLHLGGLETSLVPRLLDPHQLLEDALPAALATGTRARRWRVEVGQGLRAYLTQATLWDAGQPHRTSTRLAGLTYAFHEGGALDALVPLLGRVELSLGVARGLDGILRGRTLGSASLRVRP